MKKLLILFSKGFPYGRSEPFLENEYPIYKEYFDKVLIVTCCRKGEQPTRLIDDPTIEVLPDHTLAKHLPSVLTAIPRMLTDRMFYKELKRLIFQDRFALRKLHYLLSYALCANHQAAQAHRWLKKHPQYDQAVIYSYWMNFPAYGAVRLDQKLGGRLCAVSRAHGGDLYVERHDQVGHLPYHEQLYHQLTEIAAISEDGKAYLEQRYGQLGKVSVHRLGALDRGARNPSADRRTLRIATCSRTIPLKRLDRLVDALCLITDRPIHWIHIGGGEQQAQLERYAAEKLPPNVTAEFTGTVPNTRIYEIYGSQSVHVFVNISRTEGVPVAIMEAMSFDIPVIATAVGGTPELIDEGENGFLLPESYADEALAALLRRFMEMPEPEYQSLRTGARKKFEESYNAIPNYRRFVEYLSSRCRET